MACFVDALGREWQLKLYATDITDLRELGLDLNQARKESEVIGVLEDAEIFGRVMGHLCSEQIAKRQLSERDFARGFDGPTRFAAFDALIEAWVNFYQRPAIAKALIAKLPGVWKKEEKKAIARLNTLFGSNDSASSSRDSAESIPGG